MIRDGGVRLTVAEQKGSNKVIGRIARIIKDGIVSGYELSENELDLLVKLHRALCKDVEEER